jgi:hypothetical protein
MEISGDLVLLFPEWTGFAGIIIEFGRRALSGIGVLGDCS